MTQKVPAVMHSLVGEHTNLQKWTGNTGLDTISWCTLLFLQWTTSLVLLGVEEMFTMQEYNHIMHPPQPQHNTHEAAFSMLATVIIAMSTLGS